MADAQLSVSIVAEIDQLRDSFNKAIRETNVFDKATSDRLRAIDKDFEIFANKVDKSLSRTANSAKSASNTISKSLAQAASVSASSGTAINVGSNKAAYALTNLGRVAQDAPFGFIGIQNNLNPLLESFQSLRKESGSNAAALKSLGQSLIGPAGLGIALSVVGAAILFYQQYQQRAKKANEELNKSTEDYIGTLGQLDQAQVKGAQNAQKEITELRTLFSVYQDANTPLKTRKDAYKEIQSLYPDYFKNIAFEETASKSTKEAYDSLTQSILATARARAAQDLITKNSTKQLENQQKLLDLQKEQQKNEVEASKNIARSGTYNPVTGGGGGAAALDFQIKNRDIQKEINGLNAQNIDLQNNSLSLEKAIADQIASGADLTNRSDKQNEEAYKRIKTEALDINKILEDENKLRDEGLKKITEYLNKISGADGSNATALSGQIAPIPLEFQFTPTETTSPAELLKQRLQEEFGEKFTKDINGLLNDSLGRAFGDSFAQLGEALANGGNPIEAFGQSIIQGFGSFLSEFGGLLIKYGIAATAYGKLQAALLTPGGAIIAGPLAIAAGLALKIASGAIGSLVSGKGSQQSGYQIPAFANGVTNFRGGTALVGERGPELVTLPTGSNVITNENLKKYGNSSGGSQVFIPEMVLRGEDIYVSFNRTNKKINRVT